MLVVNELEHDQIINNIKNVTIKEDGKLVCLNIVNENVSIKTPNPDLFKKLINSSSKELAKNLIESLSLQQYQNLTFYFEMCSMENKSIRPYDEDVMYLIAVFANFDELDIDDKVTLPNGLKHLTKITLTDDVTNQAINELNYENGIRNVLELADTDFTFEGIVVQTNDNKRFSIKNPYYRMQQQIKYKGWSECSPQLVVPLILDDIEHKITHNISRSIDGDNLFKFEVEQRIEFYSQKIENEYNCIVITVNDLIAQEFKDEDAYVKYLSKVYPNIFKVWKDFFVSIYKDLKYIKNKKNLPLNNAFKEHFIRNIDKIFTKTDYSINDKHSKDYCKITNDIIEYINESSGSESNNKNVCFCGEKMEIKKIVGALTRHIFCYCDQTIGYKVYNDGSYLAICSNEECMCVQEVNQDTKEIIGFPASILCKTLRDNVYKNYGTSFEECQMMGTKECLDILME